MGRVERRSPFAEDSEDFRRLFYPFGDFRDLFADTEVEGGRLPKVPKP